MTRRTARVFIVVLAAATVLARPVPAAAQYRVSRAEVVVVCPLTIGGSFEARTNVVRGEITASIDDPTMMAGALRVDLQTLETGIGIRDKHMRQNYLEVHKGPEFAEAIVERIRIDKLDGKTRFTGILLLHGQRREIAGTAELKPQDGQVRVQAQFPIRVSEFAIAEPTYLGVGVRDEIQVKVTITVATTGTQTASLR